MEDWGNGKKVFLGFWCQAPDQAPDPENPGDYSIIGEVKSREVKKFSRDEVVVFEKKFNDIKKIENINRALGFIFSRNGFTKEAEEYCQEKGFAFSHDKRWLEE